MSEVQCSFSQHYLLTQRTSPWTILPSFVYTHSQLAPNLLQLHRRFCVSLTLICLFTRFMMSLLILSDELILEVIRNIAVQDFVNFILASKKIQRIASTRIQRHQELVKKYTIISLNHREEEHPWFQANAKPPTLAVVHPCELLEDIAKDPGIAFYIRSIRYRYHRDSYDSPSSQSARAVIKHYGEELLRDVGMGGEDAQLNLETRLREGAQSAALALLLLHCSQLKSLLMAESISTYNYKLIGDSIGEADTRAAQVNPLQCCQQVLPSLERFSIVGNPAEACFLQDTILPLLQRPQVRDLTFSGFMTLPSLIGPERYPAASTKSFWQNVGLTCRIQTVRLVPGEFEVVDLLVILKELRYLHMLQYQSLNDARVARGHCGPHAGDDDHTHNLDCDQSQLYTGSTKNTYDDMVEEGKQLLTERNMRAVLRGRFPMQVLEVKRVAEIQEVLRQPR